ncbi:MAG: hypothetical protein ABGZ17_20105, partial [Planctomycetaceae bacterium]
MRPQFDTTHSFFITAITVLLAGIPSTTHAQDFKSTHKKAPPAVVVASVVERSIKTGHRSV